MLFWEPKDFLEILEDSPMVVVSWIAFLVEKIRGNEESMKQREFCVFIVVTTQHRQSISGCGPHFFSDSNPLFSGNS